MYQLLVDSAPNVPIWERGDLPISYLELAGSAVQPMGVPALLVLHRGQLVTEQYLHGMQPDTPHLLMSVQVGGGNGGRNWPLSRPS
jgi:hypothetical protein